MTGTIGLSEDMNFNAIPRWHGTCTDKSINGADITNTNYSASLANIQNAEYIFTCHYGFTEGVQ